MNHSPSTIRTGIGFDIHRFAPGRRLVLACTSPGGAGGASFPFHEIAHLTGEARARHMIAITDTRRDAAWARANPDAMQELVACQDFGRGGTGGRNRRGVQPHGWFVVRLERHGKASFRPAWGDPRRGRTGAGGP